MRPAGHGEGDAAAGRIVGAVDVDLDPSGRVAGIKDVRSRSAGVPLRVIRKKVVQGLVKL